ncbi:hypothetical protein RRG08_048915 [Elysia crispata]|uniref:VWFA domain-containing protein n=1 Tax=Elysia crispata TaxID=231223 RepID=A0AAE1DSZ8_9GAST|nr:hypothetical protein RRG08_048915 [Elysia crispata]
MDRTRRVSYPNSASNSYVTFKRFSEPRRGGRDTAAAITYMEFTMFKIANGDRPEVPNIAIILTDGVPNRLEETRFAAERARNHGIVIFTVGVGNETSRAELADMASDLDNRHCPDSAGYLPSFNTKPYQRFRIVRSKFFLSQFLPTSVQGSNLSGHPGNPPAKGRSVTTTPTSLHLIPQGPNLQLPSVAVNQCVPLPRHGRCRTAKSCGIRKPIVSDRGASVCVTKSQTSQVLADLASWGRVSAENTTCVDKILDRDTYPWTCAPLTLNRLFALDNCRKFCNLCDPDSEPSTPGVCLYPG